MAKRYRTTWIRRAANALIKPAVRFGIAPRKTHLLTVSGRKSGRSYTTPVNLVEQDGVRYLVAPYGEVSWVKNARAAGEVTLRRGRQSTVRRVEEMPLGKATHVLALYWRENAITRPFFEASPANAEAFEEKAAGHPVFRLN